MSRVAIWGKSGVTCITFVPASGGQPPGHRVLKFRIRIRKCKTEFRGSPRPCLLVNTSDCSATIIDCTYGPPSGVGTPAAGSAPGPQGPRAPWPQGWELRVAQVLNNLAVRHRVRVAHAAQKRRGQGQWARVVRVLRAEPCGARRGTSFCH